MGVLIGFFIRSRLLLIWFCVTTSWPRLFQYKIELTKLAASLDCAASSTTRPDISMVVAGKPDSKSVVKAFWSQIMINYDFIQYLGLSKRKREYVHTTEITGRLSLLLLLVNPDFGHNGRGWYGIRVI